MQTASHNQRAIGRGLAGAAEYDTHDDMAAGAINNAIRTTGQRFDAESGLMVEKNRYYDPAAGRFIGRDPLGWGAGENRYGYVGGRPTMGVDPLRYFESLDGRFVSVSTGRTGGGDAVTKGNRTANWPPSPGGGGEDCCEAGDWSPAGRAGDLLRSLCKER